MNADTLSHRTGALHSNTKLLADRAPGPVSRDHILTTHPGDVTACPVDHVRQDTADVLSEIRKLATKADLASGPRRGGTLPRSLVTDHPTGRILPIS